LSHRRKALFLALFLILVIDLLSFTLLNMYPEVFPKFLIDYLESEALGLAMVGGFLTAIVISVALLLLSYKELKEIIGKKSSGQMK
jgi:hypothetical protein